MSVTDNYLERHRDSIEEAPPTFQSPDFPRNAWYAAAWDVELKHELLARKLCGENLVLYRRADGRPVALQDACWHRMLPLSEGKLVDDDVACGYHGLIYNSQGRCVFMPSQDTINPAACVKSYPIVERHRFAWIWMGDPALADPDRVPDLHWNDDPELGGRRRDDPRALQLQARGRQPDGPHARDVRARRQHRQSRRGRSAVRRHPRRRLGDGHALDARHRSAAVLGEAARQAGAGSTAGRSSTSSRPRRSRSTSGSRRRARARRTATARRASTASC